MAKTIITQVTDDIDGTKNAETVSFSVGNDQYTIDLSRKNRSKFEAALKPYIQAGTKLSKRSGREGASTGRGRSKSSGPDLAAVRAWAAKEGMEVATRGRISQTVMDAYHAGKN
jgi:hypothetical protein